MYGMKIKAYLLAKKVFEGVVDKGGNPYIDHCITVAITSEEDHPTRRLNSDVFVVGMLHDIVEDTHITLENIRREFGDNVAASIDAITKRKGEEYEDYLERVKMNPTACWVKIRDMAHNSDLSRIPSPTKSDIKRSEKYQENLAMLAAWYILLYGG